MTNIKHLFTLICRESIIDHETNNLSINQIYEELKFDIAIPEDAHLKRNDQDPVGIQLPLEVTSMFYREKMDSEEDLKLTLIFLDPSDKELGKFELPFKFIESQRRVRTRMKLNSIALTKRGTYHFKVLLSIGESEMELLETIPLDIMVNVTTSNT